MERRILSTVALLVAAFAFHPQRPDAASGPNHASAAIGAPGARVAQGSTEGPGTATGCAIGEDCTALIPYRETGPWTASCDWFTSEGQPAPKRAESVSVDGRAAEQMGYDPASWCVPVGAVRPSLGFLFVTLPDPVTTHLALYFDRTIEAVEAAMQRNGFYLARYYLPWTVPGGAPPEGDTSQDLRVNEILRRYRLAQPGVMIFRGAPDCAAPDGSSSAHEPCVIFVFLAGESPISGINKTQFQNAVAYARVLSGSASPPVPVPVPVHVVGPFFSGSVPSAIDLIENLRRQQSVPDFASGTMTSPEESAALRRRVMFRQTLHDDAAAEEFLLGFLRKRGLTDSGDNVVILQEDETRYGGDAGSAAGTTSTSGGGTGRSGGDAGNSSGPGVAGSSGGPGGPGGSGGSGGSGSSDGAGASKMRYIRFPRDLSRLRNASADTFGAAPVASGDLTPLPSQALSWNWKDTSKDEDGVPSFSGPQEPLSQQAVLLSISDVIRQENIKYVGIAATDIFDILFLSKFLRISAPNTRLFVLDADLLMVRTSEEGRELCGTLAVTTYPLLARNGDWTQSDANSPGLRSSLDVFPSRMTQALYNAVLLELDQDGHLTAREYARPLTASPSNDRPALWLTMVGKTGFWPVALQDDRDPAKQAAPTPWPKMSPVSAGSPIAPVLSPRERMTFDPPDGGTLFLDGFLLVWGIIHLLGIWVRPNETNEWLGQFRVNRGEKRIHAQYQAYYLICGSLALSAMLLLIAISFMCLWRQGRIAFIHPWLFCVFYAVVGLAGAALSASAWHIARRTAWSALQPSARRFPWGLYCATIAVWVYLNARPGPDGIFFALRAFYLGDGVSPLLPVELLLLLYYAWAWIFIRKVRLSESKQVRVPDPALLGPGGSGLDRCVTDLKTATDDVVFNRAMAPRIMGGFLIVYLFLLRPWAALHSVEGMIYDGFIVFLVLFICMLIVLTWGRYLFIWSRLRQILRGLERTPLRKAFDRFPKNYSWSPLWYEDASRRAYTISARSVECFQALAHFTPPAPEVTKRVGDMVKAFERVVRSDAGDQSGGERSDAVGDLQEIFLRTAEDILQAGPPHGLKDRWAKSAGSDTLDGIAAQLPVQESPGKDQRWALLAEEFVALRYVGLIHYESAQMKNLVVLLSVGFVLALAAIASYPFLAGRECVWSLAALFVVFGAAIIATFAQMDRDAILSRLSRTDPGKLDLSFYLRVASYGALPLLALLASQFPSVGHFLFAWLEPALSALH